MRIVIKNTANTAETVLCDGPSRGLDRNVGPIDTMPAASRVKIQPSERFRAATIQHFNRLNRSSARTLTVVREMSSRQAAARWQLEHEMTCIRTGTIEFTEQDGAGNLLVWRLRDAGIPEIQFVPMGVSYQITYTILGGALE